MKLSCNMNDSEQKSMSCFIPHWYNSSTDHIIIHFEISSSGPCKRMRTNCTQLFEQSFAVGYGAYKIKLDLKNLNTFLLLFGFRFAKSHTCFIQPARIWFRTMQSL